ncbi:MAG: PepSY domain-containing protein [Bacteroidota bacterium]
MLTNIWRYSHFTLTVSSSLFVFLATVTGFILAFEPIQTQLQPFKISEGESLPLSEVIEPLLEKYDEVLELEVDANAFVKVSVIGMEEELDGDFYIHPKTGEKLADIPPRKPFFEWVTNFHRSLFLKTTGRIFVGITSFLLFLIALTGCLLLIQRQNGIRHFFAKIVKEDFTQYYHVILGRVMLLPILIITLSGVYLSLLRFSLVPEATAEEIRIEADSLPLPERSFSEFAIFQNTPLRDIRKLEFPFSDDVEEYFTLSLRDRTLQINQKTGAIVSELKSPFVEMLNEWSFNVHTGTGSIWWSIILALASVNILFFMYSGGIIAYKRIRSKSKNTHRVEEAEIVILIGSENGSTRNFANLLQKALKRNKKKVFLDDLNHFAVHPPLEQLIVLTSTYGDGDPPNNARRFLQVLEAQNITHAFQYAVVGFGSTAYPKFCQFAKEVNAALSARPAIQQSTPIHLINNKSYASFKQWATAWSQKVALPLELPDQMESKKEKLYSFKITDKKTVKDAHDETFVLQLQAPKGLQFHSGDLLAIYPPESTVERLYSIGKDATGTILLSIKRHEFGLCSNYLNEQIKDNSLQAALRKNPNFHLPPKAASLTLIANGTGMAPFLGMLQEKVKIPIHLYWGGRTQHSFALYQPFLEKANQIEAIREVHTAFSREEGPQKYVQDLLKRIENEIALRLKAGGVIMICGSIQMQNEVLDLLEKLSQQHLNQGLDFFIDQGQILMDCY